MAFRDMKTTLAISLGFAYAFGILHKVKRIMPAFIVSAMGGHKSRQALVDHHCLL